MHKHFAKIYQFIRSSSSVRLLLEQGRELLSSQIYDLFVTNPLTKYLGVATEMMASTIPLHFHHLHYATPSSYLGAATKPVRRKPSTSTSTSSCNNYGSTIFAIDAKSSIFKPISCSFRSLLTRESSDGGGSVDATPQQELSTEVEKNERSSSSFGDSYVPLFVRMLGLDNDPLDREQAIVALWKYSLGGIKCIDNIMRFEGCTNLIINLLNSDSNLASEAAAGLLRSISSVNVYRDLVAESGAIEEITALLNQPSLHSEVKEQSICCLWNLSVDEKHRVKIASSDTLYLIIKSLEDEDIKVLEAAGGVLSNLALSDSNHSIMVEAGVIPKLAKFLQTDFDKEYKVIRKEARNTLLELAKNQYYRILVMEEGLVHVPLVGAAAYSSFTPALYSRPRLPDGSEIGRPSESTSKTAASQLLLGLHGDYEDANVDEAKMKAIMARSNQQFLVRIGAIELEDGKSCENESSTKRQFTILPWMDGVARLVLILQLEDESAISRAAEAIANASISEHMRNSFKEAGAIKTLVQLLDHSNDDVRFAVINALERLSISNVVCQIIEAEGVMSPLITMLKKSESSQNMTEKVLSLLARILDPGREMKLKFYDGPVNRFEKGSDAAMSSNAFGLSPKINGVSTSKTDETSKSNPDWQDLLDPDVSSRLVEIMKTTSPNLQRIAASVLEFVADIDSGLDTIISVDIESGLDAVFQQNVVNETEFDIESHDQPEVHALQQEEAGLAISAASQLFTKLLDSQQFYKNINASHFTKLLRKILKSDIPLQYKDWVAACLVKLGYMDGPFPMLDYSNPVNMEVTLYETIPRLIEQMRLSVSPEVQEAAVIELNQIISEGVVDATRAVASNGGIFPLVKLIEGGSGKAVEAALSILYNLSMNNENHSVIVAAGAVPALRRIIQSQRSEWRRALHLLRTLPT